jgi:hypothetical protein
VKYVLQRSSLVEALPQSHETEPQLPTTRFLLSLQEAFHPQFQRFLAEHVLFGVQLAPLQRSDSSSIQLPETVIRRLDKADVVKVDLVIRWRRSCITFSGR